MSRKKDIRFSEVLKLVQSGLKVYEALKVLGIPRGSFYVKITKDQKNQLDYFRTVNVTGSFCPGSWPYDTKDISYNIED